MGEKDRWHRLADLIQDSGLPASDKSVYRFLLDRADYKSAELPAQFTPTRKTIARKTSLSYSQVGYSTRHLERHGWLKTSGKHGPGHPITYALAAGAGCDCAGRVHAADVTEPSVTDSGAVTGQTASDQPRWQCATQVTEVTDFPARTDPVPANSANGWHRTLPTNTANAAGQTALSTERQREGEVVRTSGQKPATLKTAPDWTLIRTITRIVHTAPGGGLHRAELAEKVGLPHGDPSLKRALMVAYRRKQIDFVRQYVVKPPPTRETA